jgi:hypothetical protein
MWQIFALLALALIIQASHARLIAKLGIKQAEPTLVALPNKEVARLMSLGNQQFVADCYWLSFIQYLGDVKVRRLDHYRSCYNFLDLITYLDPHFVQPYWFAAFAVGADQGRPDLAAKLINRGLAFNQNNWYLPWIAGFNQYLFAHDDKAAANFYRMAAKYPDAPEWLERQAVVLESKVPTLIKEIRTWGLIYVNSKDPMVKEAARKRLVSLWLTVFHQAPNLQVKRGAADMLKGLGVIVDVK